MIQTTKGPMPLSSLRKITGEVDNENEHTTWVEYYLGDELVHRSAHVRLKRGLGALGSIANFGGKDGQ
jgi:hypothetical protein